MSSSTMKSILSSSWELKKLKPLKVFVFRKIEFSKAWTEKYQTVNDVTHILEYFNYIFPSNACMHCCKEILDTLPERRDVICRWHLFWFGYKKFQWFYLNFHRVNDVVKIEFFFKLVSLQNNENNRNLSITLWIYLIGIWLTKISRQIHSMFLLWL